MRRNNSFPKFCFDAEVELSCVDGDVDTVLAGAIFPGWRWV